MSNHTRSELERIYADIANNIEVRPTVARNGRSIPDISRPLRRTGPLDYLTPTMISTVGQAIGLSAINEIRNAQREGFFDFLAPTMTREEVSHLSQTERLAYLLYQGGLRKLDFTRSPLGYLPLTSAAKLVYEVLYRTGEASPTILYLAAKILFPDLDVDVVTPDSLNAVADLRVEKKIDPNYRRRKEHLLSLPRDILQCYFILHNASPASALRDVIVGRPQPIERYIDRLALKGTEEEIVDQLQIVVPPGRQTRDYLLTNLPHYNRSLLDPPTRRTDELVKAGQKELLHRYTDVGVITLLGAYVYYTSRLQLIATLGSLLTNPGFFVPLVERCTNRETYYGTGVEEVEVIIAYGKYDNYRCYEQEELIVNIASGATGPILTLPEAGVIRDRSIIENLLHLVSIYPQLDNLRTKLQVALTNRTISDPEILQRLSVIHRDEAEQVKELLLLFFKAGMYMRRWTGTGCYPVTKESTLTEVDPMPLSEAALLDIRNHYDNLPIGAKKVMESLVLRGFNGPTEFSLMQRYEEVIAGESSSNVMNTCIRVNSSLFILTAHYYLDKLFGYSIEGFDPRDLERIT
jgi:hypothetical protein